jgi:hypothetical protein
MPHNSTVSKQYSTCHETHLSQKKPVTKHTTFKTVLKKFLFCLSRSVFPVLPVPFCLSCLSVPFCLSCSACPVLHVLFCLSRFCLSSSVCPVLHVLFCLSCPDFPLLVIYIYMYILINCIHIYIFIYIYI